MMTQSNPSRRYLTRTQSGALVATAAAIGALLAWQAPGSADSGSGGLTRNTSASVGAPAAISRGLSFIQQDTAKWKVEKKCASCHHGAMTLWAITDARSQGYSIDPTFVSDVALWTKTSALAGIQKPRDPLTASTLVNTMALYLGVMAQSRPEQDSLSAVETNQIADHVGRYLEANGSMLTFATMTPPHPQNGPPPVFVSQEVVTLMAVLAMQPQQPNDQNETPAVRVACDKACAWLNSITPGDQTQAAALRLLVAVRLHKSRKVIGSGISDLLKRQKPDGGWGQLRELPSDAYATGQALYVLSAAGVDRKRPQVQHAVSFLVANQRENGSWPMVPRAQPGATPFTNPSPIEHYGSCWAVMGLMHTIPFLPH